MSEVFEGYERQYCEASASLTRKCTAAAALQGGNLFLPQISVFLEGIFGGVPLGVVVFSIDWKIGLFLCRKAEAEGGGDQIRHRWRRGTGMPSP